MILMILSIVCVGTIVGVNEAEMPKYSVGDKWKVRIEYAEVEGIGMLCTETFEITRESVKVTQFGKSYVCYEIDISGNGSLYGAASATLTINGKKYVSKADGDLVKINITYNGSLIYYGKTHSSSEFAEETYNPPLESSKGFPLTVGKSWSASTTRTTARQLTIDGELEQEETNKTTGIESWLIHRKELITVAAGEFDTFVVKVTHLDGKYGEWYYSPEVGDAVKQIEYYQTGELFATLELLEYRYAAAEEDFPWLFVIIGIVIAAAVIVGGVGYVLNKRRKPPVPKAPTNHLNLFFLFHFLLWLCRLLWH